MDVRGGRRRSGPIRRSGPGTYIPFSPGPFQAPRSPRVVQGQEKARRNHVQITTLLYFGRLGMGMGYRKFSKEEGINAPVTSGAWIICARGPRAVQSRDCSTAMGRPADGDSFQTLNRYRRPKQGRRPASAVSSRYSKSHRGCRRLRRVPFRESTFRASFSLLRIGYKCIVLQNAATSAIHVSIARFANLNGSPSFGKSALFLVTFPSRYSMYPSQLSYST